MKKLENTQGRREEVSDETWEKILTAAIAGGLPWGPWLDGVEIGQAHTEILAAAVGRSLSRVESQHTALLRNFTEWATGEAPFFFLVDDTAEEDAAAGLDLRNLTDEQITSVVMQELMRQVSTRFVEREEVPLVKARAAAGTLDQDDVQRLIYTTEQLWEKLGRLFVDPNGDLLNQLQMTCSTGQRLRLAQALMNGCERELKAAAEKVGAVSALEELERWNDNGRPFGG